jgi:hypothetical protein
VFHIDKTNVVATDTDGIDKAMGKVRSQGWSWMSAVKSPVACR